MAFRLFDALEQLLANGEACLFDSRGATFEFRFDLPDRLGVPLLDFLLLLQGILL